MALVLCLLSAQTATAGELRWGPHFKSTMRLDDNVRLASADAEAAWGFDTGAGVNLAVRDDVWSSLLAPRFNFRRFAVGDDLDTEEFYLDFTNEWREERRTWNIGVNYARESTLVTEATDTGLQNEVKDRDSIGVAPSVSLTVSDTLTVDTRMRYNRINYVDSGDTGLFDYTYLTASITPGWQLSSTLRSFISLFISDFDVDEISTSTLSYGTQLGLTQAFDPYWELSGAIGIQVSEMDFIERSFVANSVPGSPPSAQILERKVDDSASAILASAVLTRRFESAALSFRYTREISPTGRGAQGRNDHLDTTWDNRLSNRWTANAYVGYDMRRSEGTSEFNGINRNLVNARGALQYRLNEEMSISVALLAPTEN